jgi:hypothetical protein
MASKKTIYLSDPVEKILGPELDSLSGRISSIVIRYGEIMRLECPALSENEWLAICDVLNGTWLAAESSPNDPAKYIGASISDGDKYDGIGEKWGVDALDLARRVRDMRYFEQCAIIEIATRFWKWGTHTEQSYPEILSKIGAKITPSE